MMKKVKKTLLVVAFLVGCFWGGTGWVIGQTTLQLEGLNPLPSFSAIHVFSLKNRLIPYAPYSFLPRTLIPEYVRKNPRGYSYLCRLELEIEEKLPIGVWIKFGEEGQSMGRPGGNARVRFKLFQF